MGTRACLVLLAGFSLPSWAQESMTLQGGTTMAIQQGTVMSTAGKVTFAANPARMHLGGVLRLHDVQASALPAAATGRGIRISDTTMSAAVEWNMAGTAIYRLPFLDHADRPAEVAVVPAAPATGQRMVHLSTCTTAADNTPFPPGVSNVQGPLGLDLSADMADRFWRIGSSAPFTANVVLNHPTVEAPANGSDDLRITLWDGGQWASPEPGQSQSQPGQVSGTFTFQQNTPLLLAVAREVALGNTILLSLRAMLQGPLNPTTGLMNDALRSSPAFPLTEPYSGLGLEIGGGQTIDPVVLATSGPDAIVDWVLVELRSDSDPYVINASRAALVQRDGDVVDVDGLSPVAFSVPAGNYRIAVKHRNHLGVLSAAGIGLGPQPAIMDLSNGSTPTYGSGALRVQNGYHALWAGNVRRDEFLKYVGTNNDRDPILTRIGGTLPTNTVSGYWPEDVTLDGVVKYVGTGNDRDVILSNIGGTTPNGTKLEQLP